MLVAEDYFRAIGIVQISQSNIIDIKAIIFNKALFLMRTQKILKKRPCDRNLFISSFTYQCLMKDDFGCPENQYMAMVVPQVERSLMRLHGEAQNWFLEEENKTA